MNAPAWPDLPALPDHLLMVLRYGKANALTYPKLAELIFGIPATPDPNDLETVKDQRTVIRQLQDAVPALRKAGKAVVTGSEGIWLSRDATELDAAAKALQARAVTILVGARALRRTARAYRMQGQATLFEEVA